MAIFKCKMCGGTLEINNNETVAVCEYCGTKQTLPKLDDEKRVQLYDRANHFRRENEFDKAMGIYEMILSDDKEDCESYWGLVLCRYGIEYVEDPRTHKRIPTVNRAQFTSIFDDDDYKNAIKYADGYQKDVYEAEASVIDKIQKGILEISNKEEPFDVFICYKETDSHGNRTQDSVYAQDIYAALTKEGYKVFFSRITLEDKLGSAYEPYIFAALNSAKVMLVVGTEKDNFNAVWVKNEWSRFLSLIKAGKDKALIPVYKDISPYEMPEEFQYLQSQDMGKIGFMQDLVRGISKLVDSNKTTVKETVIVNSNNSQIKPLLKRTFMFLEEGDFARADEFCEQVLNLDPECAEAYLGKLMVDLKVCRQSDLRNCTEPFDANSFYQKIIRFADANLINELKEDISYINERNEIARKDSIYEKAISIYQKSKTSYRYKKRELYQEAYTLLDSIGDWKDSTQISEEIRALDEALRIEDEQKDIEIKRIAEEHKLKTKRWITFGTLILVVFTLMLTIIINVIIPSIKYNNAIKLMDNKEYQKAIEYFMNLEDYKDSEYNLIECRYLLGEEYFANEEFAKAAITFGKLGTYKDARQKSLSSWDKAAVRETISSDSSRTVGLKSDGTVVAVGYNDHGECDVSGWKDIVAISTGFDHTVGLKSDGTVVVGDNDYGQCDVSNWTDIVAISAGDNYTVGLKSDGTVVAVGNNYKDKCNVSGWKDIVAISAGGYHTVGLKSDGTVVAVGYNDHGECDVSGWKDIVAISADGFHTVGLKSDGTVVAVGYNRLGYCDVEDWKDIVAISAGVAYTVGLKSDGTVVAVGDNDYDQCDVSGWKDIVAISASGYHTVGLKSDGTVVAVGDNDDGECDVGSWKNIKVPAKQ